MGKPIVYMALRRTFNYPMAKIVCDNFYYFFIWLTTAFLVHLFIKTYVKPSRPKLQTPPSPRALPIIGHLHLIGSVLPESFQTLARLHGPLMQLRLGAATCVVASNADVAKEIMKTLELNFASRPEFGSSEYSIYRGSRFATAQYGDYWRFMKKLCMTRLLSAQQLDQSFEIREQETVNLMERVKRSAIEGKPFDLSSELAKLTNNMTCRMVMSTRFSGTDDDEAEMINKLVKEIMIMAGKLIVGDMLGPLKMLDLTGNGKKLSSLLKCFDGLVEKIIRVHEERKVDNNGPQHHTVDLMDILLEIYRDTNAEFKLSRNDIKSFFLDIIMAGTHTSSIGMQWAMGELINRPQVLKKLREEINSVVGPGKVVKESDIPNLPYLQAVFREILRLHPSAPLAIRECGEDCMVNGYVVKAKTRVFVNVYAVMRDPDLWTDPDEFIPERFLEGSEETVRKRLMEYKGQNFSYLPFGSGRRGCPGSYLALLMMQPVVANLMQWFEWKFKDSDMANMRQAGLGLGTEMEKPLVCYPSLRLST